MIERVSMRLCPFSTVAGVVCASGGSSAGTTGGGSQGGKLAERLGDGGFQLGLVVLDDKGVVAAAVGDRSTDLASCGTHAFGMMTEYRIAGDDRALERQLLQQNQRRRDLVLIGLQHDIADDDRHPGGEG